MSIATAIKNARQKIETAYTAISNKGGTLPATQDLSNMPTAIASIPSGSSPVITSLSVTPTTSSQTITAPSGTDGYSPVNVSAVTSSIDANITAGNIKKDVQILGVTGTYEGTTPTLTTKNITENGTYNASSDNVDGYSSVTVNVSGGGGSQEKTYGNYYILDDDTVVPLYIHRMSNNGVSYSKIIITDGLTDYDNVSILGGYKIVSIAGDNYATPFTPGNIQNVFYDDSNSATNGVGIKKFVLKSITGNFFCYNNGLIWAADNPATALTLKSIDLSNATSVTLQSTFVGCSALEEVLLTSAKNLTLGRRTAGLGGAFKETAVSSLSFPALTTTSSINLQYAMSDTGTDIVRTLHFPSNLETTIQGLSGYPLFGGTSGYVTLAFDLPATS